MVAVEHTALASLGTRICFVFGSNLAGIHGAGAAKSAYEDWGAAWGVGEGPTGYTYAIPTKDTRLRTRPFAELEAAVARFLAYARANPDVQFLVTRVGCGLAGWRDTQVAPLFADAPPNCMLSVPWREVLGRD